MGYQLRQYRVKPGKMGEFVAMWRNQVVPARQAHGFEIHGAWTSVDGDGFVWILSHDDFDTADRAYYDSPERAAISPPPSDYLDDVVTTMMEPVSR